MEHHLIVLGCSSRKLHSPELLPAVRRYDGPYYRVLNSFLRTSFWPDNLSVAVLSAKYGLIGGLTPIEFYDQRMDKERATELRATAMQTLLKWSDSHDAISVVIGEDYLPALGLSPNDRIHDRIRVAPGPIGAKLNYLSVELRNTHSEQRPQAPPMLGNRALYFLPDWDDMLDADFDFQTDTFSNSDKSQRNEQHCIQAMQPKRICDGVVVSLAQHQGTKGILRRLSPTDAGSLAPASIRKKYGLDASQFVFGDCGAFSYVNEDEPTISTEQALSLYQLYGFDMGASVDHIPVPQVVGEDGKKRTLSEKARRHRARLTKLNAALFMDMHRRRHYSFVPVGIIQGLSARNYAKQLAEYVEMGYTHIAVGGLVPRTDQDIVSIATAINNARKRLSPSVRDALWIHLFGVFRPKIQLTLRGLGIASFDSATYFRKAWLRSGQNYLGRDGKWYAAIRVPLTSDARTLGRLQKSGIAVPELKRLEGAALNAIHEYGNHQLSLEATLRAVWDYDCLLDRSSEEEGVDLRGAYQRTLRSRIWEKCECPVCRSVGIDVVVFRGYNRNKRRGAHNTGALYGTLQALSGEGKGVKQQ